MPVTVKLKPGSLALALKGDNPVSVGTGVALIVKVELLEVPPPGVGLKTVTAAEPAVAMSVVLMAAVSIELLTNVVVRSVPFQRITELLTKFEPFTCKLKPGAPAMALFGESDVIAGTGLLKGAPSRMFRLLALYWAVARSERPSPLKSPTATKMGP